MLARKGSEIDRDSHNPVVTYLLKLKLIRLRKLPEREALLFVLFCFVIIKDDDRPPSLLSCSCEEASDLVGLEVSLALIIMILRCCVLSSQGCEQYVRINIWPPTDESMVYKRIRAPAWSFGRAMFHSLIPQLKNMQAWESRMRHAAWHGLSDAERIIMYDYSYAVG